MLLIVVMNCAMLQAKCRVKVKDLEEAEDMSAWIRVTSKETGLCLSAVLLFLVHSDKIHLSTIQIVLFFFLH